MLIFGFPIDACMPSLASKRSGITRNFHTPRPNSIDESFEKPQGEMPFNYLEMSNFSRNVELSSKSTKHRMLIGAIVATPSSIHVTPLGILVSETGERKEVFARERKEVDSLAWRTHRSVAPVKAKAIVSVGILFCASLVFVVPSNGNIFYLYLVSCKDYLATLLISGQLMFAADTLYVLSLFFGSAVVPVRGRRNVGDTDMEDMELCTQTRSLMESGL
ncbi:hypothetical protein RND71_003392 [Anisodus tanguticus]|uniref:Uncharacterized protein n=1 Tax=Anisodus tanguticus TaxID=243964 RepID=A0AAE1VU43_9SOLA|nr:hypothetical protein RND71_003392 [Anisodus tanguticus]